MFVTLLVPFTLLQTAAAFYVVLHLFCLCVLALEGSRMRALGALHSMANYETSPRLNNENAKVAPLSAYCGMWPLKL